MQKPCNVHVYMALRIYAVEVDVETLSLLHNIAYAYTKAALHA